MVTDRGTAEEQLLKLIEGSPSPAGADPPQAGAKAPAVRALGWQALQGRLQAILAPLRRRPSARPPGPPFRLPAGAGAPPRRGSDPMLNRLHLVNRVLMATLVLLAGYLAADLLGPGRSRGASRTPRRGMPSLAGNQSPAKPEDYMKPMSVYIHSANQRNPFMAPGTQAEVEPPQPREADHRMKELRETLVVVGIDRSGTPKALIEDTKLNRTYFVRAGEQVAGATVKEITSDGVTLEYEGQSVELPY